MEEASSRLRSVVDQVIGSFERTIEVKDAEIAGLRSQNEQSDRLIAQLRRHSLPSPGENGPSPSPLPLPRDGKGHDLCNENLQRSKAKYDKLLKEANAQAQNAKTLELMLEKSQAKNREWDKYFQLTTTAASARLMKKMKNPVSTPTARKSGNCENTVFPSPPPVALPDVQSARTSTPEPVGDGIMSSCDRNLDRFSSPQLPPQPSAIYAILGEPSRALNKSVLGNPHYDSDHIPASASTEAVEAPVCEGLVASEIRETSSMHEQLSAPSESTKSSSIRDAKRSCAYVNDKDGSKAAPISLADSSSGSACRPSSFSEGFSITGIDLDRSFRADGHDSQRKRKVQLPTQSESFAGLSVSDKRSLSEPPSTQLSRTSAQGQKTTTEASPLREIDGNTSRIDRNFSDKQEEWPSKKRKTQQQQAVEAIPSIAEDGDDNFNQKGSTPISTSSVRRRSGERLKNLLEAKSPNYPVLSSSRNLEPLRKQHTHPSAQNVQSTAGSHQRSSDTVHTHSETSNTGTLEEHADLEHPKTTPKTSRKTTPFGDVPPGVPSAWISALKAAATDSNWNFRKRAKANLEGQKSNAEWYDAVEKTLDFYGVPIPLREEVSPQTSMPTSTSTSSSKPKRKRPDQAGTSKPADSTPLRCRPLKELTLSDFKINPSQNDGLPYAYSDVVRKRDQRACLPGCTRPNCCGDQFRALAAEAASLPTPPSLPSGKNAGLFLVHDTDTMLLCEYLGENPSLSNPTISALSTQEREKLLSDAKTKGMADKFGRMRHRWRHPRAVSPPGFWEVDMQGTQEDEEERRMARERVRGIVRERWLEARRGGGVWGFRDE